MSNPPIVFVGNEQDDQPVDTDQWLDLARKVLMAENVSDDMEVSVLFVDEASIAELNEKFMGKTGSTDVLSFPIDEGPTDTGRVPDNGGRGPGTGGEPEESEVASILGDVVICPAVAYRNAPAHAGEYEDELALLMVHGLLHLLGMDHAEDDEAEVMEARERELLSEFYRPIRDEAWPTTNSAPPGL